MSDFGLVLVCTQCRWKPPGDLVMSLVQAHFDLEDGHDPEDLRMELTAWCDRCGVEMELNHSRTTASGLIRHEYLCNGCRRTWSVNQNPPEAEAAPKEASP